MRSQDFHIDSGILKPCRFCHSPNFNSRPTSSDISLLVIHNISLPPEQFGGDAIEDFFCNRLDHSAHAYFEQLKELHVSAHCLIKRTGEVLQFVNFKDRAWHAGRSEFEGRRECNDFSIGIELEGTDTAPYTTEQYSQLVAVTLALQSAYPLISNNRITGHSNIAPERKTDPGPAFDWEHYRSRLT